MRCLVALVRKMRNQIKSNPRGALSDAILSMVGTDGWIWLIS